MIVYMINSVEVFTDFFFSYVKYVQGEGFIGFTLGKWMEVDLHRDQIGVEMLVFEE